MNTKYKTLTEYRAFNECSVEKLLWPKSDTDAYCAILKDWKCDSKNWLKHVKNKNTVIQAGGNCGMYPLLYSRIFNTVYTFEPDPLNFYCLTNNCQVGNIIKINTALGNGELVKLSHYEHFNIGTIKSQENENGYIPAIKIDNLNLKSCDMIHLDIEGYESKALKGAIETIKKFNPIIVLEHGHGQNIIKSLGYKIIFNGRDKVYKK